MLRPPCGRLVRKPQRRGEVLTALALANACPNYFLFAAAFFFAGALLAAAFLAGAFFLAAAFFFAGAFLLTVFFAAFFAAFFAVFFAALAKVILLSIGSRKSTHRVLYSDLSVNNALTLT